MIAPAIALLMNSHDAQGQSAFDDHAHMMSVLGVKSIRRGPDPNSPATYDEVRANSLLNTLPDPLTFRSGRKVVSKADWTKRRREIAEEFEREVYGRIPKNAPSVRWSITGVIPGEVDGIPVVTRTLEGRVDNRLFPAIQVMIQASVTSPVQSKGGPCMVEIGGFGTRPGRPAPEWQKLAIHKGWSYSQINPWSVQPDNDKLNTGIIGLCNKGGYRKPDDWGALRAWAWGVSRLIDAFGKDSSLGVSPRKVGVVGVSRFGKAALVAQAFDPRVAVGFIGSSGEGGSKLHRRLFGEQIENLAGGEFYWMAGNIIKYGSADPQIDVSSLPVDSHELLALCAPRPCFISHGVPEKGDAHWIDAKGSWMAGILAGKVYRLLGKTDFGVTGDFQTAAMPPVGTLMGGDLAWRQHEGGHEVGPNWPSFFEWIAPRIPSEPPTPGLQPYRVQPWEPTPRTDANSRAAHDQLLAKKAKGKIDLYFVGDSITRRWGTSDPEYSDFLENWKANFHGWNAANFGWGADATQHILWRLRNGEIDGLSPKAVVVLAGTNNIGGGDSSTATAKGVEAIVRAIQERCPKATILLTAILPRNDNPKLLKVIRDANRRLARIAESQKVRFIDPTSKLLGPDQKLVPGVAVDGLHLGVKGYQIWADALHPHLEEILGPRSRIDLAPPPTGNPGL